MKVKDNRDPVLLNFGRLEFVVSFEEEKKPCCCFVQETPLQKFILWLPGPRLAYAICTKEYLPNWPAIILCLVDLLPNLKEYRPIFHYFPATINLISDRKIEFVSGYQFFRSSSSCEVIYII